MSAQTHQPDPRGFIYQLAGRRQFFETLKDKPPQQTITDFCKEHKDEPWCPSQQTASRWIKRFEQQKALGVTPDIRPQKKRGGRPAKDVSAQVELMVQGRNLSLKEWQAYAELAGCSVATLRRRLALRDPTAIREKRRRSRAAPATVDASGADDESLIQQMSANGDTNSTCIPTWDSAQPQSQQNGPSAAGLRAADHVNDHKHHLLLAATGSVATIKIPNILQSLSTHPNLSIRLILTTSATKFLQSQSPEQPSLTSLSALPNVDGIYTDEDEWRKPWIRGDNILHIELRRWADLMVIAPLSANSLAKLSLGLSDDLVSSVARAWDTTGLIDAPRSGIPLPYAHGKKKGIVVAPAMNTAMYIHPVTAEHLAKLAGPWGFASGGWFEVLGPVEKELACGDTGSGAMRDWREIVEHIEIRLGLSTDEDEGLT